MAVCWSQKTQHQKSGPLILGTNRNLPDLNQNARILIENNQKAYRNACESY